MRLCVSDPLVPNRAVALLSGGLDSALAIVLSHRLGYKVELCLNFDYGQRSAREEEKASSNIAAFFGIPIQNLKLPWFSELSSPSSLLSKTRELPHLSIAALGNIHVTEQSAREVWVPNRNGVFIEIAACLAESLGATTVITGFNREEAVTFPDNSTAYCDAISLALSFSTSNQVRVLAPTSTLMKTEIVREGKGSDFPFGLLWSCYEGGEIMCGECESCLRLKRALFENEVSFANYFKNANL